VCTKKGLNHEPETGHPESQGQNLALTVLHVPHSLDSMARLTYPRLFRYEFCLVSSPSWFRLSSGYSTAPERCLPTLCNARPWKQVDNEIIDFTGKVCVPERNQTSNPRPDTLKSQGQNLALTDASCRRLPYICGIGLDCLTYAAFGRETPRPRVENTDASQQHQQMPSSALLGLASYSQVGMLLLWVKFDNLTLQAGEK